MVTRKSQGFTDQILRLEDIVTYFGNMNIDRCPDADKRNCYKATDVGLEANIKTDLYGVKPGKLLSKISSKLSPWPFASVPPTSYSTTGDVITATYELPYTKEDGTEAQRTVKVEIDKPNDTVSINYKTSDFFRGNSLLPFRKSIRKDANKILRAIKRATLWKRFVRYFTETC